MCHLYRKDHYYGCLARKVGSFILDLNLNFTFVRKSVNEYEDRTLILYEGQHFMPCSGDNDTEFLKEKLMGHFEGNIFNIRLKKVRKFRRNLGIISPLTDI